MKITRRQLSRLIKEEIDLISDFELSLDEEKAMLHFIAPFLLSDEEAIISAEEVENFIETREFFDEDVPHNLRKEISKAMITARDLEQMDSIHEIILSMHEINLPLTSNQVSMILADDVIKLLTQQEIGMTN